MKIYKRETELLLEIIVETAKNEPELFKSYKYDLNTSTVIGDCKLERGVLIIVDAPINEGGQWLVLVADNGFNVAILPAGEISLYILETYGQRLIDMFLESATLWTENLS